MSGNWVTELREIVARDGTVVRVSVIDFAGSTPRETGAAMVVSESELSGTIGGGALEMDAMQAARKILGSPDFVDTDWHREVRSYQLGPSLGQCCGGATKVGFEVFGEAECAALEPIVGGGDEPFLFVRPLVKAVAPMVIREGQPAPVTLPGTVATTVSDMLDGTGACRAALIDDPDKGETWYVEPLKPARTPLFLYGAGHVGRAIVAAMKELPFEINWVDTGAERFPADVPAGVTAVPAKDPAAIAGYAPENAYHVVMTYSHPMDLDICRAVLARGKFAYLGVIGSKTKRARFTRMLKDLGIAEADIGRMVCPIGLDGLSGKEPPVIALSVAADLMMRLSQAAETVDLASHREAG